MGRALFQAYSAHCIVISSQRLLHSVHYTLCSAHGTMNSIHYTLYSAHGTMNSTQWVLKTVQIVLCAMSRVRQRPVTTAWQEHYHLSSTICPLSSSPYSLSRHSYIVYILCPLICPLSPCSYHRSSVPLSLHRVLSSVPLNLCPLSPCPYSLSSVPPDLSPLSCPVLGDKSISTQVSPFSVHYSSVLWPQFSAPCLLFPVFSSLSSVSSTQFYVLCPVSSVLCPL